MNNIVKNLILALTAVCAVALIVFVIQLIVFNSAGNTTGSGASISGGTQQGGESSAVNDEDINNESGTGDVDTPIAQETPRPPPQGTRREIMVSSFSNLIIYARDDLFDFEQGQLDWWFVYNGAGEATLEITFIYITQQGVAAHAESFLNDYSGSTTSAFTGVEYIKDSALRGYHAITQTDTGTYEAWIHELTDSDLSLVFVIFYENDVQREALYEVLSTLDMQTAADSESAQPTLPETGEPEIAD